MLAAPTYAEAVEIARRLVGTGISQQTWALRRRIFEVADIAASDHRIVEVHPEVSFRALKGEPLRYPKKDSWSGGAERRGLLGGGGDRGPAAPPPDVVVASSGSLAHVYFTSQPDRMSNEAIETHYPGVIEALASHPGIGLLLVRSAAGHALVLGQHGCLDLNADKPDGSDPLVAYGLRAADNLRHLNGFANVGDLILLGAVDGPSGEVTGFEELVGSHGGLGGEQAEPFILTPETLKLTDDPPVGAPALYSQLIAWREQLKGENRTS